MSRSRDIAVLAPLKARLFDLNEEEARRKLEQLSARELRRRRTMIEHAYHEIDALMTGWDELNKQAGQMLAEARARTPSQTRHR